MDKQRISYVNVETLTDPDMLAELQRCAREGTPRPESSAVRAHVPAVFWSFANSWRDVFVGGVCEHAIKELCRVYVSRSVKCEYCGNQRSMAAARTGLAEEDYRALMDFESSERYDERQKAALSLAQAMAWHSDLTDADWERLHRNFSEPELVELGYFIGLTLGQQSFLRLLDIGHHEVLDLGDASLAPGFETKEAMAETVAQEDYWARK
jgi:alkylhydroperoxidase family enzyme